MKKYLFLALTLGLASCSSDAPVQTVDWYKEHTAERLTVLKECATNPGELGLTPNCQNAQRAHDQIGNARKGYPKPARI